MQIIDAPVSMAGQVFGSRSQVLDGYFKDKLNRLASVSRDSQAVKWATDQFRSITSGEIFRKVNAIKNMHRTTFEMDHGIIYIKDVATIQTAPNKMVGYLMASPNLKSLAKDGSIEAYGDRYDIKYASLDYMLDPYYRDATNNMVIKENNNYIVRNTYSPAINGDLNTFDRINILSAWKYADLCVDDDIDPTSEYNNPIV